MKYSTKLSDTVHVMVLIAINQEKSLSSASIAESVHTNPGFVRQLMLKLKKAELMTSVAGHARPSLSKPADQITLLDIYKAVEGEKPLLHLDTHTNPECKMIYKILYSRRNENGLPDMDYLLNDEESDNDLASKILYFSNPGIFFVIMPASVRAFFKFSSAPQAVFPVQKKEALLQALLLTILGLRSKLVGHKVGHFSKNHMNLYRVLSKSEIR